MNFSEFFKLAPKPQAEQTQPVAPQAALAMLTRQQAVDYLYTALNSMPDADEALKEAGVGRASLRRLMSDDEISAAWQTRLGAVLATPWRLEPWQEGGDIEACYNTIRPHMPSLLASAMNAVLYGYSVQEIIWRDDGATWGIASIIEKPFEWFEPQQDGSLIYRETAGGMGEVWPPVKYLLARNQPEWRNPKGRALLAQLYYPWSYRVHGWRSWMQWLEQFGVPFLHGHAKDGAFQVPTPDGLSTTSAAQAMLNALNQARKGAAIVTSGEDAVDILAPATGSATNFVEFERAISARIQKTIIGQTLTSQVDGQGSYAAAKVHDGIREVIKLADLQLVKGIAQTLINHLWAFNRWAGSPPEFVMEDGAGLGMARAERDKALSAIGLQFTKAYFLDRYDLREEDFDLAQTGQPVQPAMQATGFTFSPGRQTFTPGQQQVEDLADKSMSEAGELFTAGSIRAAIEAATDPEDLSNKLAALLKDLPPPEFEAALERALFAADVLGWHNAEKSTF